MVVRNRRGTEWFTSDQAFAGLAAGAQANVALFSAGLIGARFVKGTTITRIVMDITMQAQAVAQQANLLFGIVRMNADAVIAGGFPDPNDVSDRAGWMVRGKLQTIQDSLSDSSQWDRRRYDIRSQRIMRAEEDELQIIADATGFACNWSFYIRVLVKWA